MEAAIATYLIVQGDNPNFATRVEAKNIQRAIEGLELEDGDSVLVYRMAAEPRRVTVTERTVREMEIE